MAYACLDDREWSEKPEKCSKCGLPMPKVPDERILEIIEETIAKRPPDKSELN